MTILTPTSKPDATLDALAAAPFSGDAGGGLPDISVLTQLANAFFQTLPGTAPVLPSPGEASSRLPSLAPVEPVAKPSVAPAQFGRSSAAPLPEAYAPALPLPPHAAPRQPGSDAAAAYYFLAGAHPATASYAPQAGEARVDALPYELPGQFDTAAAAREGYQPAPQPAVPGPGPSAGHFYFLEGGSVTAPRLEPVPASAAQLPSQAGFDVHAVRRDFPILAERVNGKPLVWLDNAATTQKPQAVIDRLTWFYAHENSNIHRAAHELAARATDAYEGARQKVADFIGAASPDEIVFVRGATEAINLVANTYGKAHIGEGDEIVVSLLEHHANIVPWQQLAAERGARLRVIPVDDDGQILLDEYRKLLCARTKLVAITQVSNALGTITPVADIIALAHAVGARVLVDGAQSVSHLRVNVRALDADFFVFSGHKIFGPTGIGVVYGKQALLDSLPPWQGGGNMIADVTFERTLYQPAPARFEAGTGNIADAVGLGAALDYLTQLGLDNVAAYEHGLLEYTMAGLRAIPGVRLIGTAAAKTSVASFVLAGFSPQEVGAALSREGVAVRSGHHCAQPILRRFGLEATVRPSLAFYNTCDEVDVLLGVVRRLARQRT